MNPRFSPRFRDELTTERAAIHLDLLQGKRAYDTKDYSFAKVVVSGPVVEVYEYEVPVRIGGKPPPKIYYDEETGERILTNPDYDPVEARSHNARRAKATLRRTILSNFDNESGKFITLTFRDGSVSDVTDVTECNKAFKEFIQRLRYEYRDFKYACVIEFQDTKGRGAVHYHMLSDLGYVRKSKLAEIWGNGFVKINKITHVDNLGAYVTKYMTKNTDDPRLKGRKAYHCSKNLNPPIELQGADAYEILIDFLENKKEVFANSYESEHQGKISYREYNLQRT